MKDGHRLSCALTRFKDILVVIHEASALTNTGGERKAKAKDEDEDDDSHI